MTYPLTLHKGATFERIFAITNQANSTPVVLTGHSVRLRIFKVFGQTFDLVTGGPATPNGSIASIENAVGGLVRIKITDEETANALNQGSYWLQLLQADGDTLMALKGLINLYTD